MIRTSSSPAKTIEEFLKDRKNAADYDNLRAQRENRRDRFMQETEALMKHIKTWLDLLSNEGPVFYRERPISIYEEGIGDYRLYELLIDVADRLVIIRPIGTMIYGALGRIDLLGKSEAHLIMTEWGKWQRDSGTRNPPVDFNQEEFKNVLLKLVSD